MRYPCALALTLLAGACTYQGAPIPVAGETRLLEGQWEGTYVSGETGRRGTIFFTLKAGTDSAYGDVVMLPLRLERADPPTLPEQPVTIVPAPRLLTIAFVQCEDGAVTGQLDAYNDPETGERLRTIFIGKLKGKKLEGTFTMFYPRAGRHLSGTWEATRLE